MFCTNRKTTSQSLHPSFRMSSGSCLTERDSDFEEILHRSWRSSPNRSPARSQQRGLHRDLGVLQWSELVEVWGARNENKKTAPAERLHFTCLQLQILAGRCSPYNRGMLLILCVKASSAPDGRRRQRETTHEMFPCIRSCERGAQEDRKNAEQHVLLQARREQNPMATSTMKKWLSLEDCFSSSQVDGISIRKSSSKMPQEDKTTSR